MALMLRKSVLPKNISLLKCMKGRPIASASFKKNPAVLSAALKLPRRLRHKSYTMGQAKVKRYSRFPSLQSIAAGRKTRTIRHTLSSPTLAFSPNKIFVPIRGFSTSHISSLKPNSSLNTLPVCRQQLNGTYTSLRSYAANAGCPCPFPCGPCGCKGGCSCLPPPCNTPPKCIQYMTGYYYYPYGTWFCGPYHVSGTCVPVPKPGCVPCGKCCPCACICPAGAVFNPSGMGQQSNQNPGSLREAPKRGGVSRLFPTIQKPSGYNPRNPIPPIVSSIVYSPCTSPEANMKVSPIPQEDICIPDIYVPPETSQWSITSFGNKRSLSSIFHRRFRQKQPSPQLDRPRFLSSKETRDRPNIKPHAFNYSSIPQYKNPFPRPYEDIV
ncbi:uncharacterized protein LOC125058817 isoform X2 [Pieris napi]|uniref:uncharacterized protein LOC125058817 isoform X2 n=1 Tax=Pieris napi TaxID=78633 RepID=UPI001FBB7145|nr:uncharacterized protein LOC125058817 isoform X2 [Pieris napi]